MSDNIVLDPLDPYRRSKWEQITISIVPRITGSISFIASGVMIYMILRSDVSIINQDPFRRIIFMMCVVDLFQSSSAIISTTASPRGTPGIWGAMGNTTTCDISGWIFQFSSTAPAMYICSLSIHYFFFVQYRIKRSDFSKRVEPFLHCVPILWSIFDASWLVATEHINNADVVCWNASLPYNCVNDPSIDCERGENTYLLRAIFNAAPNFIALNLTGFVMFKTYMIYKSREKNSQEQGGIVGEDMSQDNAREAAEQSPGKGGNGATFNNSSEPINSGNSSNGADEESAVDLELAQPRTTSGRGSGMVRRGISFRNPSDIPSAGVSSTEAGEESTANSEPMQPQTTSGRRSGIVRNGATINHSSEPSNSGVSSTGAGGASTVSSEPMQHQTTRGQRSGMMARTSFNFNNRSDISSTTGAGGGESTVSSEPMQHQTTSGRGSGMARRGATFNNPASDFSSTGVSSGGAAGGESTGGPSMTRRSSDGFSSSSSETSVGAGGRSTGSSFSPSSLLSNIFSTGNVSSRDDTTENSANVTPTKNKQRVGRGSGMTRRGVSFAPNSNVSSADASSAGAGGISTTGPSSTMSAGRPSSSNEPSIDAIEEQANDSHNIPSSNHSGEANPNDESVERKRRDKIMYRTQEALTQSYLFIGSFAACYFSIYVAATFEFLKLETPYLISLCMWTLFPLQGFFNIVVFTRPHVVTLKKYDKKLSTMEAIWEVVKSGGDAALRINAIRRKAMRRTTDNPGSLSENPDDQSSQVESRPPSQIVGDGPAVSSLGYMEELFIDDLSEALYGDTGFDIYNDDDISLDPENASILPEDLDGISVDDV